MWDLWEKLIDYILEKLTDRKINRQLQRFIKYSMFIRIDNKIKWDLLKLGRILN